MTQPANASPELIMLVGLPGCGKSTWRDEFFASGERKPEDWVIISRDDAVEEYIGQNLKPDGTRLRYDEVMADPTLATRLATEQEEKLNASLAAGKNVIVDRTNLVRKGRDVIVEQAKSWGHDYSIRAVVFDVQFETILQRAEGRGAGKHIPVEVLQRMHDAFEPIAADEGFAAVTVIEQNGVPNGVAARAGAKTQVTGAPDDNTVSTPK